MGPCSVVGPISASAMRHRSSTGHTRHEWPPSTHLVPDAPDAIILASALCQRFTKPAREARAGLAKRDDCQSSVLATGYSASHCAGFVNQEHRETEDTERMGAGNSGRGFKSDFWLQKRMLATVGTCVTLQQAKRVVHALLRTLPATLLRSLRLRSSAERLCKLFID